jgi:hypothetical protein
MRLPDLPAQRRLCSVSRQSMREILFDVSWWVPALVGIIGIVLLVSGNNRQQPELRNAGAIVILVGMGWLALSFVIDTPRKICERLTRQAVQAAADGDWKTFDDLLASTADARYVGRSWRVDGRQAVDLTAKMVAKNSGLHSASVKRVRVTEQLPTITVAFTAFTDTDLAPGHPIDSDWELDFRPTGDQWQIQEIRVSRVDDTQPEGIRESLNKH